MFSIFGFVGQHIYNLAFDQSVPLDASKDQTKENLFQRFAKRKWSPFSVLTDEQYGDMLKEKLLRLEADISLMDDKIAHLKVSEKNWLAAETEKKAKAQHSEEPQHTLSTSNRPT